MIAIVVQNWYGLLIDPDKRSLHIGIGYLAPEVTPCREALPDSSGLTTPTDWQDVLARILHESSGQEVRCD